MYKGFLYSILLGFVVFSACRKECPDDPDDPPYETTPYKFKGLNTLPPPNLAADNKPTEEGVYLGRMLFYDPILSADSTMSCNSCHNQANAFTDNGKRFSTGINGLEGTRNSMPIFNLMYHKNGFFWDGRADILRHQALFPIQDELEMDETIGNMLAKLNASAMYREHFKKAFDIDEINEESVGKALEQFMSIIVSGSSRYDEAFITQDFFSKFTSSEYRGFQLFNSEAISNDPNNTGADCGHCHGSNLFMIKDFMNNGLDKMPTDPGLSAVTNDPNDFGKFKVPSLRNIALTAPYMHDGRFETLEEVIEFYMFGAEKTSPNLDVGGMHMLKDSVYLSEQQKADLIAFLHTLTDPVFINNEEYKNPFE